MMSSPNKQTYDDRLLTRYLLGALPEEEAERLDELCIVDEELARVSKRLKTTSWMLTFGMKSQGTIADILSPSTCPRRSGDRKWNSPQRYSSLRKDRLVHRPRSSKRLRRRRENRLRRSN